MSNSVGQDFVLFVECVFGISSLAFYRHDVSRLLLLLRKTHDEAADEPWYAQQCDPLTVHCEYMMAKMSFDVRESIRKIPVWLKALAGHLDELGTGHRHQKDAFLSLCEVLTPLLKKYGPDSHDTIPPPLDDKLPLLGS